MTEFLVGTGGWAYFKIPKVDSLEAYSKVFNFVEINSTFYQVPKIQRVKSWRKTVPMNFEFSVRCNGLITHEMKFDSNPKSVLAQFALTEDEKRAVLRTHAMVGLVTSNSQQLEAALSPTTIWHAPEP